MTAEGICATYIVFSLFALSFAYLDLKKKIRKQKNAMLIKDKFTAIMLEKNKAFSDSLQQMCILAENENADEAVSDIKKYIDDVIEKKEKEKKRVFYVGDSILSTYVAMNHMFKIPVIENEYHEYKVSKVDDYDSETGLGYTTDVKKLSEEGNDYYEFDPIMVIQEENDRDGKNWTHRNLEDVENTLINRMLFIVNNRTAKGKMVDTSQINGGYGVYELPIDVGYVRRKIGRKSIVVPDPKPLSNQLAMVYPLDEENEYVEMSMSDDHRYLAVFSVKDGKYFVEMVDADNWISKGAIEMFPASEKMTYAWGEDGTLAVTNHKGHVAVFSKTESESEPYELIYSGELGKEFDKAFFDTQMVKKKNSYAKYQYGIDEGLSVAEKDGKVALVQNLMIENSESNIRDASLECAIIEKSRRYLPGCFEKQYNRFRRWDERGKS